MLQLMLRLFDESGVKFGYFSTYSIQSFNALVMGYEMMNGFQSSNFVEIGIGLGLSSGDGIIGCLLGNLGRREVGYNIGISARAVVIVGAQVGVFVGTNGVCFSLGYAKGLNISLGAGLLTLH
jgi:hypothetical protein